MVSIADDADDSSEHVNTHASRSEVTSREQSLPVVARFPQNPQEITPKSNSSLRIGLAYLRGCQRNCSQVHTWFNELDVPSILKGIGSFLMDDVNVGKGFGNGLQRFSVRIDCNFECRHGHPPNRCMDTIDQPCGFSAL